MKLFLIITLLSATSAFATSVDSRINQLISRNKLLESDISYNSNKFKECANSIYESRFATYCIEPLITAPIAHNYLKAFGAVTIDQQAELIRNMEEILSLKEAQNKK